jgi:cardiolipin synthase
MMAETQSDFPDSVIIAGNSLNLVYAPGKRLAALLQILDGAEHSLKIFYYMFENDEAGTLVMDRLLAACQRGVSVELIVDSFGSNGAEPSFFQPLQDAGGRFAFFSPKWSTTYLVRNHQKMVIADDCKALIGGFNIADQYFALREEDNWADIGLLLQGSEVLRLAEYYQLLSQWTHRDNRNLRVLLKQIRRWNSGTGSFRWLVGGPGTRFSRWFLSVKKDLENANRLDLVSAYFSPGQGIVRRISKIAGRGYARLILAGKTDNGATIGAARLLYGYMLKRGVRIAEYQPDRLHCKLLVIDDAVYIGSANFDARSLFINFELMLRIENAEFADHTRSLIDNLDRKSERVEEEPHKKRATILTRLRWFLSYFVVNIMDYSVSRRFNFGLSKE